MKLNLDEIRKPIYLGLAIASISSIHLASFGFFLPSHIRPMLDVSFNTNLIVNLFLVITTSAFFARYAPQILLAIFAHLRENQIHFIYFRRGYYRAPTFYYACQNYASQSTEKRKKTLSQYRRFGRTSARLNNFVSDKIQEAFPIVSYEKYQIHTTVVLALLTFLVFYVGLSGLLIFLFALVLHGALHSYFSYNSDFRFKIFNHVFSGDDPNYSPSDEVSFDIENLICAAITAAVVSSIAGPARLSHLANSGEALLAARDVNRVSSIIGTTSNGVIVFEDGFKFISFPLDISNTVASEEEQGAVK